ncbi:MAG: XdhC family protein [Bacteroidetes bacterium]|nr:MAG: XdhC family protein [Bacteroidota bacterium]
MENIYDKIVELRQSSQKAVLCTIVSTKGSVPRKIGAKMLVMDDSKIFGTIGGGSLEKDVIEKSLEIIKSPKTDLISYNLTKDLGMKCGGSVDIFIETLFSQYKLYIFGAGHIGKALAKYTENLDFDVIIIDERENIFDGWLEGRFTKLNITFTDFFSQFKIDENTFIVIVTKGHDTDSEVLENCIKSNAAYIGMIGSKRKASEIRKEFVLGGIVTDNEFDRIDIPIGLEIKAEGPDEIAISIASKLVLEKNKLAEKENIKE